MGGLLVAVSLAVFLWAVAGLISPNTFGLPNRAASVGVWFLSVVLFFVGGGLLPEEETSAVPEQLQSATPRPAAPPPQPDRTSPVVTEFNRLTSESEARQANINRLCEGEWPTDFRMQEYCREQQAEGYSNLVRIYPDARENIGAALVECITDWSDGGLFDWRMIHYCTDRQLTSWRNLR